MRMGLSTEKCSFCQSEITLNSWYQFIGDKISCETCYKNNYKVCRICGKTHLRTDMQETDINFRGENISVCKKCARDQFKVCNGCNKLNYKGDLIRHGDENFCHECFNVRFDTCSVCRNIFPKGEVVHKIRIGHQLSCKKCYNWHGPIIRYEHTNYLEVKGVPQVQTDEECAALIARCHLYGVELEVVVADGVKEKRGPKAQEVLERFETDFLVMKEDRSVMDQCGFEICTAPATLDYQKLAWGKFFDKMPENLASYTNDHCGLHIHCSRKPLSLLAIGKMLVFVNDAGNKSFIECIAGRAANNYCKIQKKKHGDVQRPGGHHEDRHEAINLMNPHTIEFRIFKGTLKRQSFFKALEFCDALIHFCLVGNHSIKHCRSVKNFIGYVEENKKIYPHLWAFICAKWLKQPGDWVNKYGFGSLDNEV